MITRLFSRKKPLVSLLMPAYNAETYIEEAIKSVLLQDYLNWELIIINDASQDHTLQIAQEFSNKDSRIQVITNENRQGIAKSRNKGLQESRGDFIGHIDADDKLKKNALKTMMKGFSRTDADLVYSGFITIDSNNQEIKKNLAAEVHKENTSEIGWQHFGMYKKNIALAVGGFNENLITCSDGDFFVKIAKKFYCKRIPKYLYFYRWHDQNIGHLRPHCYDCKKNNLCDYYKEWNKKFKVHLD